MVADTLVAQRPIDQHEVGRRGAHRRQLAGRGHAQQQLAAAGEELLGDQHREGRADGAADDAELDATVLEPMELGVVAGPGGLEPRPARRLEVTDQVAVGVQDANPRHPQVRQALLPTRFAQQVFGAKDRRLRHALVGENGRLRINELSQGAITSALRTGSERVSPRDPELGLVAATAMKAAPSVVSRPSAGSTFASIAAHPLIGG